MFKFEARILYRVNGWARVNNVPSVRREDAVFSLGICLGAMHERQQPYRTAAVFRVNTKTGEGVPCFHVDIDEYEAWEAEQEATS